MCRFTGLAYYYCRFVEGYSELAAQLTAHCSQTAWFTWTLEAQASFNALKPARHWCYAPPCVADDRRK